jgi:hypothetical protein
VPRLPEGLSSPWHVRGYNGILRHNAKAVYQRYIGWYDANPANLDPLPPVERGRKYVEYMGGAAAVIGFNMLGDALRDLSIRASRAGSGPGAGPRLPMGSAWAILSPHTRSGPNP